MISHHKEVKCIWHKLLEDKSGLKARATLEITVIQLAYSSACMEMRLTP
jgi:hypothetical protein